MRFHQLPAGARFEYKGVCYRKINSLTASPEQGGKNALIPRSAEIQLAEAAAEPTIPAHATPQKQLAAELLQELHQYCQECLARLSGQVDTGSLAKELEQHYLTLRARVVPD